MMYKASAKAHPIQGLIKYHGLKNSRLRIPYHDSISVCTAPWESHTTVEFSKELEEDYVEIDQKEASPRAKERVQNVLHALRKRAGVSLAAKVVSRNNFPSNVGLGSSASGFAALAAAASCALGLELSLKELSTYARLGAGSASRAVTGGFSYWYAGHSHETSYSVEIPSSLDMAILVALIPRYKETEDAHREALTSPFFAARMASLPSLLSEMRRAIEKEDFQRVGELAEKDSLSLHAVTMTGTQANLLWTPETLRVIHEVRTMRKQGIPVYFSIDTGATVYINTLPPFRNRVRQILATLGIQVTCGWVGKGVRIVEEHLF